MKEYKIVEGKTFAGRTKQIGRESRIGSRSHRGNPSHPGILAGLIPDNTDDSDFRQRSPLMRHGERDSG
jgi:hypothetical protein